MKSIKSRFTTIQEKNPNLSTLMCFNEAVINQNFSIVSIRRNFNNLVDKDDYARGLKRLIVLQAIDLSKHGKIVRTTL